MTNNKQEFLELLFVNNVKVYSSEIDGRFVVTDLRCTNKNLNSFISKLSRKYQGKITYSSFFDECIWHSYRAIEKFDFADEAIWAGVIDGSDVLNLNRLIKYIKVTIENEAKRFVNPELKATTVNGENVMIGLEISSLNQLILTQEGNEEELVSKIAEDMNFNYSSSQESHMSEFSEWLQANKAELMTKRQLEVFQSLQSSDFYEDMSEEDLKMLTGISSYKKLNAIMKRIEDRVVEKFVAQQKGYAELKREKMIDFWSNVVNLADENETADMNKRISDWFISNYDNARVFDLIADNTSPKESVKIVKLVNGTVEGQIDTLILYKLFAGAEKELNRLISTKIPTKKPLYKELAKKQEKYETPCRVYNREGKLIRIEQENFVEGRKKQLRLLPTGVMIELKNGSTNS